MDTWRPSPLLRVLLPWTSLTFLLAWLPFIRSPMDGKTYTWGFSWWGFDLGGAGVTAQYWLPVAMIALGVTIVGLGCRGARKPFHWLLLGWHAALFSNFLYLGLAHPEDFRFRGDTAGIDVSLAWIGPALTGTFLALSILWVLRDLARADTRPVPSWNAANRLWLGGLVALLPVQFVLLRFGEPHGTTDLVGVVITIAQWFALPFALKARAQHGRETERPTRRVAAA